MFSRPPTLKLRYYCVLHLIRFIRFLRVVGQIGVQHTDNAILEKISRGHGVEATIDALRLLKDNCFKVPPVRPLLPPSGRGGRVAEEGIWAF